MVNRVGQSGTSVPNGHTSNVEPGPPSSHTRFCARLTAIPAINTVHVAAPVPVTTAPGGNGGYAGDGGGGGGGGGGECTGSTSAAVKEMAPTTSSTPTTATPREKVTPTTTPASRHDHCSLGPSSPMRAALGRRASQLAECTPDRNSSYALGAGIAAFLLLHPYSPTLMR